MRCSIIPPYLLRAVAEAGPEPARSRARETLLVDAEVRRLREDARAPGWAAGAGEAVAALAPKRTVSDAHHGQPPGTVVRHEGGPATGDGAADRAYDGLGATYGFYAQVYSRDSLDGRGMPLRASVHVQRGWDNAEWDGERMLFGDGDGEVFGDFTSSLDVIGHELTHGVTQYEAAFDYQGQSGALNESMSDVFGSCVKQWSLQQTAEQADWLIGEELLLPGVHGVALRSMKAPGTAYDDPRLGGKDPQPANMRDYVETSEDEGGVHLNSGIPNHAFYLAATAIGGSSGEGAGRVWYAALRDRTLTPQADFAAFAAATLRAAQAVGGSAPGAVRAAWTAVGVEPTGS
ncbi:protealysin propeptide [Motilibacter rhizosphaerae]|uniref:Neutral metalloproteinase n=1 Tax=Motilibacter rhizosphaerae TaxID=598652 RepID=A0A4Q7NSK5_9ACTN|nr:M4 family metallopeptidase [Motilibacter rhizosphaerae]RZS89758.1 protealysin propeptide [Motilibacter rhizosphaerae]